MNTEKELSWMRPLILNRIIYFVTTGIIALIVTYGAMQTIVGSAYESYWNSINHVQTVDFNILAATATGTASQIIQSGDVEKAQEFVNANYCLFRIQLKECSNPECSETRVIADNAQGPQNRCQNYANLDSNPFLIPVFEDGTSLATIEYPHAYATEPQVTELKEKPIGFVSLHRSQRPSFNEDFWEDFIPKWLQGQANRSRHDIYKTATYVSMLLGLVVFMLLFVIRQFYISHLKRKIITGKLVRALNKKINTR